jgi:hypothetical protein
VSAIDAVVALLRPIPSQHIDFAQVFAIDSKSPPRSAFLSGFSFRKSPVLKPGKKAQGGDRSDGIGRFIFCGPVLRALSC